MKLGIDVATKDVNRLIVRLARLRSTIAVCDGGRYREQEDFSQVHLDTHLTEADLDDWLWCSAGNIAYVGCFTRAEERMAA